MISKKKVRADIAVLFFLERAGELRINILRREKGGKEPPKNFKKCYSDKGSVTHPKLDFLSYTKPTTMLCSPTNIAGCVGKFYVTYTYVMLTN